MKSMECADIIRDLFIYLVIFKSTFHGGEEQKKQVLSNKLETGELNRSMDTDLTEVATADSKYIETCEGSTNGRIEEQSAHRFLIGCLCRSMSLSVSPPIGDYQRCDDDVGLTWSSYWVVHLPSATWNIDQTVITFPHKEPPSPNNKKDLRRCWRSKGTDYPILADHLRPLRADFPANEVHFHHCSRRQLQRTLTERATWRMRPQDCRAMNVWLSLLCTPVRKRIA